MASASTEPPRRSIYYWKCDRPAAFHGTAEVAPNPTLEHELHTVLRDHFPGKKLSLRAAGGQGNHITYRATIDELECFVRLEDGPERDDYMEVESRVLADVRALGVATPRVLAVDASRQQVPFAWQVLEFIDHPDLNQLHKAGRLDLPRAAHEIGASVARWQTVQPRGFGPFDAELHRRENRLEGFHPRYEDYFFLHLERHLRFLRDRDFLSSEEAAAIAEEIETHRELLALSQGCLVHKDLALWNILGSATQIAAFIDWDDAISGDPMDDLALLGCFYDGPILARALKGYATVRPLPADHRRRFWLHLLRNMIVKAVIRVGAGYFDRTDRFFLIGAGGTGADLKVFTRARLAAALRGLREDQPIDTL
jgi:aminoglycoside phosphotransferase (APT) family kinase protein